MAEFIPIQGDIQYVEPANTRDFQLEELQKFVGGYFELVRCPMHPQHVLVVDEEGLVKDKPVNVEASILAMESIRGDALFCLKKQIR